MKTLRQFVILFLACATAPYVLAWGEEGHRTIGAMVDQLIAGTAAAQHVHELLGDETLSAVSVWADAVKGRTNQTEEMLRFKAANPNHSVSHYTDIPFEESKYRDDSIGATQTDVVHAIPACILILQGKPEAQSVFKDVSPRVALRLLIHFVEDIHQPLHVGSGYLDKTTFVDPNGFTGHFSGDLGGNRLLFGGTNGLHYYWDTTVVRADMKQAKVQTPQQFAAYLLAAPEPIWKASGPLLEWDRTWADESLVLSAMVHDVAVTDEDDSQKDDRTGQPRPDWHIKDLSPEYIAWSEKTAEEQITKAAYRLAAMLKTLWPDEK
jgi:hypothetical protein